VFTAPRDQFRVARSFSELVFGLRDVGASFSEDVFDNSPDVFVEEKSLNALTKPALRGSL
jgi:hypothetical protein